MAYYVSGGFGFGDPDVVDVVSIEFYQAVAATGAFPLGVSPNDDYATCRECVVVYADYDPVQETVGAYYFQTGGTLVVDPSTPPGGGDLIVDLNDLRVTEVTFDPWTAASTPVPGGACYDVAVPSPLVAVDGVDPSCGPLSVPTEISQNPTYAKVYNALDDMGLGDPSVPDLLSLEFFTASTGTFDLASATNANYQSCEQCVVVYADYDDATGAYGSVYFQRAGLLTVPAGTPPGGESLVATLSGLALQEVQIDGNSYLSTPVPGGACAAFSGQTTLVTTSASCTPFCGDHVCGSDGCGGVCGANCAGGGTCSLGGTACQATPTCAQVTVGGAVLEYQGFQMFAADLTVHQLGAPIGFDALRIFFIDDEATGTVDLASPFNSNWATCTQCVLAEVDWNGAAPRHFFQSAGTMTIAVDSDLTDGPLSVGISGLRLVEVTYDPNDAHSTPVPNGACIDVTVSPDLSAP